jgi:HEAT repeat protein
MEKGTVFKIPIQGITILLTDDLVWGIEHQGRFQAFASIDDYIPLLPLLGWPYSQIIEAIEQGLTEIKIDKKLTESFPLEKTLQYALEQGAEGFAACAVKWLEDAYPISSQIHESLILGLHTRYFSQSLQRRIEHLLKAGQVGPYLPYPRRGSRSWDEKWAKEEGYVYLEIEPFIDILQNDKSPSKRAEAAQQLGSVRTLRSVMPLIEALQDDSELVRDAATEALHWIAKRETETQQLLSIIEDLQSEDIATKQEATVRLYSRIVQKSVSYLCHDYDYYRQIGIKELVSLGEEARAALPELIKALQDEDFFVRKGAIEALGNIGDKEAVPHLIPRLKDHNRHLRAVAARALGTLENIGAIIPLVETLTDDEMSVREEVNSALRRIMRANPVKEHIQNLPSKDETVRQISEQIIKQISEAKKRFDLLIKESSDQSWLIDSEILEEFNLLERRGQVFSGSGMQGSSQIFPLEKTA